MKYIISTLALLFVLVSCENGQPLTPEEETIASNVANGTAWYTNYTEFTPPYNFMVYTNVETNNWFTNIYFEIPMPYAFTGSAVTNGTTVYCAGTFCVSNATNSWEGWRAAEVRSNGTYTNSSVILIHDTRWSVVTNALSVRIGFILNTVDSECGGTLP